MKSFKQQVYDAHRPPGTPRDTAKELAEQLSNVPIVKLADIGIDPSLVLRFIREV